VRLEQALEIVRFVVAEAPGQVGSDAAELENFDPQFSFFKGGVAGIEGGRRVGAVGVSGLRGEVDEELAERGIRPAGLDLAPDGNK
jgi:uncharacterized protein GlcG (DUF336 family)